MAKASFNWNVTFTMSSHSEIINNLGFGKELNKQIAKTLYKHYFKYVPYDEGRLSEQVRITSTKDHGTIVHTQKYARKQYYGVNFNRNLEVHPLATSYWDVFCWKDEKNKIIPEIDALRKKQSRRQRRRGK